MEATVHSADQDGRNLTHAISLHHVHYNVARPHQSLTARARMEAHPGDCGSRRRPYPCPCGTSQIAGLLD